MFVNFGLFPLNFDQGRRSAAQWPLVIYYNGHQLSFVFLDLPTTNLNLDYQSERDRVSVQLYSLDATKQESFRVVN